ncbi:rhodanese-like domain-containing protein [Bacillus sp. RG28]|uniref:Rhodanese-like domain-containing protein n=1 Tax=Gottfriedia endophytica TaxID=2820819 RepID=A0A940NQB8_9BACI|nr:rhodanese-like domain-containing protein [Gottfriedia endophytica]MBP0726344.1 rhodanese-like domain-containing protein [Gottfriedia endophytica]
MKEISTEELQQKIEAGETLFLVDVREDDEVAAGIIPEAVHIRMGDIPSKLDFFSEDNEYIFICRSGGRSGNVCEYLSEQGFNVTNVVGGMLAWEGETK